MKLCPFHQGKVDSFLWLWAEVVSVMGVRWGLKFLS